MQNKKVDLHKLALTVGWQPLYVDDGYTCYEYVKKVRGVESLCHVLQLKDDLTYDTITPTFSAIVGVLPVKLQRKIKKLSKKCSDQEIDNVLDLICWTVQTHKDQCDYCRLAEYGSLVGVDIASHGYEFSYDLPKTTKSEILSLIESSLPVDLAPILGKMKKLDYKIGYIKQNYTK